MDPMVMASIGQSVSNTVSSAISNAGNKKAQARARAHDINMWDKTNAYNDPKAQMERLRNAGLNPNMVYGGSQGQTAGQANALPGAKAENYEMNLGNPGTDLINFRNTEAQTDNHRAQFQVIQEEAKLKNAQYIHELDKMDLTKMSTKERAAAISKINQEKQFYLSKTIGQNYHNIISKHQADWSKYGLSKGDNILQSAFKLPIDISQQGLEGANRMYKRWKKNPDGYQWLIDTITPDGW